ncbi:MAG: DUF2235 domain-containing protein [Gemmatimonadota bacterium]|nr:DUF2235 domain-containing protein [Gemmatimonadota bacterium]
MARNIIICCDGTDNQFGASNTSVVRLAQVAVQDPNRQIVYYDPGVGTLPETSARSKIAQTLSQLKAQAFGTDIDDKVCVAYGHLMEFWEPGDQVFIFGFSRGAYTARVLAGLLYSLGLLPRGNQHLLPYVIRIFKSLKSNTDGYWELCNNFRWSFARPIPGDDERRFPIHFVGLFDTVSSVGWIWNPTKYQYTFRNPGLTTVRHAVALDERRAFFRQNLFGNVDGQDLLEMWFAGVHSDVGGGYSEADGGLWRVTFEWMLAEARNGGLLVDPDRLQKVLNRTTPPGNPWAEPQHESLKGVWWIGEVFPKHVYDALTKSYRWKLNLGRHRTVPQGALLPRAVLERLRLPTYSPPNLSENFKAKVRALPSLPDSLNYDSKPHT